MLQRVSTAQSYREWLPVPPLGRGVACVWAQQVAAAGPASILGWPAAELVDLHLALDELWGRSATPLAGRLTAKGSPDAAAALLEEEILRHRTETAAADPL
jgi:hypothetical protein